jgi:hypothetical protein
VPILGSCYFISDSGDLVHIFVTGKSDLVESLEIAVVGEFATHAEEPFYGVLVRGPDGIKTMTASSK